MEKEVLVREELETNLSAITQLETAEFNLYKRDQNNAGNIAISIEGASINIPAEDREEILKFVKLMQKKYATKLIKDLTQNYIVAKV